MKKYRSERKGRRRFDNAIEYGTVALAAAEMTRIAKPAVRATGFLPPPPLEYDVYVYNSIPPENISTCNDRFEWGIGVDYNHPRIPYWEPRNGAD
jgi:hypothetical protein